MPSPAKLDLKKKIPLGESILIEASAGTGKTFSITNIILRAIMEGTPVERILAVTFTDAATSELRGRVRDNLRKFADHLSGADTAGENEIHKAIAKDAPGTLEDKLKRINEALLNIDLAQISTIHGFCQRVLTENAFETKTIYGAELCTDDGALLADIVNDFWRKQFVGLNSGRKPVLGISRDDLLEVAKTIAKHPEAEHANLPSSDMENLSEELKELAREARSWKKRIESGKLEAELQPLFSPPEYYGKTYRNIADRLNKVLPCLGLSSCKDAHATALKHCSSEEIENCRIKAGLEKDAPIPSHPFFDFCSKLREFFNSDKCVKSTMFAELAKFVKTKFPEVKERRAIWTYDDLLQRLRDALVEERERGESTLVKLIRDKYDLALVDEFQDTDHIQNEIFRMVFGESDRHGFFMIGDPKQSIYAFRGADIFSYLAAKSEAHKNLTLLNNFRSEPDLIAALNTVFTLRRDLPDAPAENDTFVFAPTKTQAGITYDRVASSSKKPKLIIDSGAPNDKQNFHFWIVESRNDDFAERDVAEFLAEEMIRLAELAQAGKAKFDDGRPLDFGDIAVLVYTHKQASLIKRVLERRSIPAVLQNSVSVFESNEAWEIEVWLNAVENPSERRLRPLLASTLMGFDAGHIVDVSDKTLLDLAMELAEIKKHWKTKGVYALLMEFLHRHNAPARALRRIDGERVVTNYRHIAELLHQREEARGRDFEQTKAFLAERIENPDAYKADEYLERLESDKHAVTIMTMHKAKGLEFPVVFCPFLWSAVIFNKYYPGNVFLYNEPTDNGFKTKLDFGFDETRRNEAVGYLDKTTLAENIRLVYVAMTRAINRCYLPLSTDLKSLRRSALPYLLTTASADDFIALAKKGKDTSFAEQTIENIMKLDSKAGIAVEEKEVPNRFDRKPAPSATSAATTAELKVKTPAKHSFVEWSSTSFSGLALSHPYHADSTEKGKGIFALPRGKSFGLAIHKIFENYFNVGDKEFHARREHYIHAPLSVEPAFHGEPGKKRIETVEQMVENVLSAEIAPKDATPFKPAEIAPENAKTEFPFFHPIRQISPEKLKTILARHGIPEFGAMPDTIGNLEFHIRSGYIAGEIDLLFRHGGKYFVLDWKTNHLGATHQDYAPDKIASDMERHLYFLQALIYSFATHLFLESRLKDYDYESDFGGFIYVYVRGVDQSGNGVFSLKPPKALIDDMKKLFIGP